jgi:putative flippase GtrA
VTSPTRRPAVVPATPSDAGAATPPDPGAATPPEAGAAAPPAGRDGLRVTLLQFVRFCLVGGSGVVVNLIVFTLVLLVWQLASGHIHSVGGLVSSVHGLVVKKDTQGLPAVAAYLANAAGFIVSVMTNYYLNRRWTFRSTKDVSGELPKFFTVSLIAYGGQLAIFWLLREQAQLAPIPSQLLAIVFVMPINFIANKLWSFR